MLNKERKTFQRFLSLLCSGAMLFSMMPTQVFAEETAKKVEKKASETVEQTAPEENDPATQQETSAKRASQPAQVTMQNAPVATQNTPTGNELQPVPLAGPVTGIELNENNLTLTKGETGELTATVTPEDTADAVTWESSDQAIATVSVSDSKKATITAEGAGETTVTVKCESFSATCTVVVKDVASSVTISADRVAENATLTVLPDNNTIQMTATTVPAAEYCTDSVEWSVESSANVSIDATGLLTVTGLTNDTENVTVTAKAGAAEDTFAFTLAKAEDAIAFSNTAFTYGQQDMMLDATAMSGSTINYTVESQDDTVGVTVEGNQVKVTGVGTFTVKAVSAGNEFYKAAEVTQMYTVNPKALNVIFTAPTETITKTSDGNTGLLDDDKETLKKAFALQADQIVADDNVTLTVDVDAAVFDAAVVGPRTIDLSNVSFTLAGDNAANYTLNSASGSGTCLAKIEPAAATDGNVDLTSTGNGGSVMSGAVTFTGATQGVEPGSYWYGANGVPVTLVGGYALYAVAGDGSVSGPAVATVENVTYLTVESGAEFYICDNAGIYYGPYTLTYLKDETAPRIVLNKVTADDSEVPEEGGIFGKKAQYTITVSDDESGVNPENVYYAIADEEPDAADTTAWTKVAVNANGNDYTFTVTAPESGTLFVKAEDRVANSGTEQFRALVLEEDAPTLTVTCDGTPLTNGDKAADFKNEYSLKIDASEPVNSNQQSGIQKVTYSLEQVVDGEKIVSETVLSENQPPKTLDEIANYLSSEIEKNLTALAQEPLNGEYLLTLTATDFCGNSTEFTYTFMVDTTAPTVSVQMANGNAADNTYYYKSDNCGITVVFQDEHLAGAECKATIRSSGQPVERTVTAAGAEASITFTADEVKNLGDGTITVQANVTDTAGNAQDRIDAQSQGVVVAGNEATFVLDTTAPVLTGVTSTGGNYIAADEKVYFNTDFAVSFAVEDTNYAADLVENRTVRLNDGTDAQLTANEDGTIQLAVAGSADNAVYTLAVSVQDKAGNLLVRDSNLSVADQQAVTVVNGVATMNTQFVLDTTGPQLVKITSTQGNDYSEGVYYTGAFDTTLFIDEPNCEANAFTVNVATEGGAAGQHTISVAQEDGYWAEKVSVNKADTEKTSYTISLAGTDKAGNQLTIAAACEEQATVIDSKVTLKPRIMDNVAPQATISYTELDPTHFYYENGSQVVTAYYKDTLDVTIGVTDAGSLDDTKLFFSRSKDGVVELDYTAFGSNNAADYTQATFTGAQQSGLQIAADPDNHTTDGTYIYSVYGTDKAGNPLTVTEHDYYSKGTEGASVGTTTGCGIADAAHTGAFKVMDTTHPTAEIRYTALDVTHYYLNGETSGSSQGANAYYNKDFAADFTFADTYGIDSTKVKAVQWVDNGQPTEKNPENNAASYAVVANPNVENQSYTFAAYGEDKAGNPLDVTEYGTAATDQSWTYTAGAQQSSIYHKVLDTVAPTFTLTIPDVADPSISVDENNRAYYNTDISATFQVNDANLDSQKIKSAMDSNIGVNFNYETADVAWDASSLGKSDSVESDSTLTQDWTASADGVYRFQIRGEDRAGNTLVQSSEEKNKTGYQATIPEQDGYWTYVKVRDTRPPQLTVALSDSEVFYQALLGEAEEGSATSSYYNIEINEPYRSSTSASGTLTKSDCSPTSVVYQITSTTNSQNLNGSKFDYADLSLSFSGEQIFFFEVLEIRDRAGNKSVMPGKTNKIYLDATAPNVDELAPTISVVAHASGEGRGTAGTDLFNSNVTVRATVTDPGADIRSSGLYQVYYKVLVNGEDWTDKVGVSGKGSVVQAGIIGYGTSGSDYTSLEGKDEQITSQDVIDFAFDASTFNYNDVKIYVWAEDNSGNLLAESQAAHYFFGIDITAPTIRVSYDNNDAQNEKYFKDDRIATVVVTERNFDPSNTIITTETSAISGWTYAAGSMPNGDDDTWTCQVSYTEDGDYTFDVTTTDLLGHKAESVDYGDSVAPREFTVDKTAPVIRITFNNNDVRNGKYYNKARTATVSIEEHNFSADGATVTTTAAIQEGSVTAPGVGGWSQNGDMNTATVPFTQDGNYTMHVEFVDLAGNEAVPEDVDEFVVDTTAPKLEITGVEDHMAYNGDVAPVITYHDINYDVSSAGVSIKGVKHPEGENLVGTRTEDAFGGSFTCENIEPLKENDDVYTATGSVSDMAGNETNVDVVFSVNRFGSTYLIAEDTQQLLDNYYTNTPQDLHVIEINVDGQVTNRVTTSLNGEVTTLQEGTDYTVKESVPGWHEFDYTIKAANFTTEGVYDVTLYSEDEAGNASSNRSIKEDAGATSDLPINFVVDMTPPVNVITGVDQDEQYIAAERTIVVNYDDNIGMKGLTLYVNDEVVAEYDADDLQSAGGSIQYVATAENYWQQFKVVSNDLAGNVSEESTVRYLLTGNLLVQYYNNKPIFYGSLAILAALIVSLIIFIKRKKHQPVNKA